MSALIMGAPVYGDREVLLRDHAATTDLYKMLVDTRFKLLTFVPTVTTISVGILSADGQKSTAESGTMLLVGVGGLLVSLAIVVYEVRNSQIHDRVIHRIKHLERLLGFTPSYAGGSPRGMFGERGRGGRLFTFFTVWHDRALSMVYGTVVALWAWTVLTGMEGVVGWLDAMPAGYGSVVKAVCAGLAGSVVAFEIVRQGGIGREPALIYTLADVISDVHRAGSAGPAKNTGAEIWRGLEVVSTQKVPLNEINRTLYWRITGRRPSIKQLITMLECSEVGSRTSVDPGRLVDLAISSGMVTVRQRSWPPWNLRDGRARTWQVIEIGPLPSAELLSQAIIGGQEVLECLRAQNSARHARTNPHRRMIELARDRLVQRYGLDAPWCSFTEVELRCQLLSMATEHGRD